jgi:hypothetical protein
MTRFAAFLLCLLLSVPAFSQGQQQVLPRAFDETVPGVAGVPTPETPTPPTVPEVVQEQPAQPQQPAVVDPCAAYMSSYESYVVCQDRIQKIQRMKDAKTRRDEISRPAPKAEEPAKTDAPAEPAKTETKK